MNVKVLGIFPEDEARKDFFDETNCYGKVRKVCLDVFNLDPINTIEHLAQIIAEEVFLINKYFSDIEIEIKKPNIFTDCRAGIKVNIKKEEHVVYLGLGTNIGDLNFNIEKAIKLLESFNINIINKSSNIITEPMYKLDQPNFLNTVIKVKTYFSPKELLSVIEHIMKKMGRVRLEKNGPRIIDIDLLLYDDIKLDSEDLIIPHPRIKEREFVLSGLGDLDYVI